MLEFSMLGPDVTSSHRLRSEINAENCSPWFASVVLNSVYCCTVTAHTLISLFLGIKPASSNSYIFEQLTALFTSDVAIVITLLCCSTEEVSACSVLFCICQIKEFPVLLFLPPGLNGCSMVLERPLLKMNDIDPDLQGHLVLLLMSASIYITLSTQ